MKKNMMTRLALAAVMTALALSTAACAKQTSAIGSRADGSLADTEENSSERDTAESKTADITQETGQPGMDAESEAVGASSIGVIGGSDGPTAIFIAGKLGGGSGQVTLDFAEEHGAGDLDSAVLNSIGENLDSLCGIREIGENGEAQFPAVAHEILFFDLNEDETICYVAVMIEKYEFSGQKSGEGKTGQIKLLEQLRTAAKMTFQKNEDGELSLSEFWTPEKGWEDGEDERFLGELSSQFPDSISKKALQKLKDTNKHFQESCAEQAKEYQKALGG